MPLPPAARVIAAEFVIEFWLTASMPVVKPVSGALLAARQLSSSTPSPPFGGPERAPTYLACYNRTAIANSWLGRSPEPNLHIASGRKRSEFTMLTDAANSFLLRKHDIE